MYFKCRNHNSRTEKFDIASVQFLIDLFLILLLCYFSFCLSTYLRRCS